MKDYKTDDEKYQQWIHAVNKCWAKGWKHAYQWVFYSPSGSKHDLSAANLDMLDIIESNKIFIVDVDNATK